MTGVRINVVVPRKIKEALQSLSDQDVANGRKSVLSDVIREALSEYLSTHGYPNKIRVRRGGDRVSLEARLHANDGQP